MNKAAVIKYFVREYARQMHLPRNRHRSEKYIRGESVFQTVLVVSFPVWAVVMIAFPICWERFGGLGAGSGESRLVAIGVSALVVALLYVYVRMCIKAIDVTPELLRAHDTPEDRRANTIRFFVTLVLSVVVPLVVVPALGSLLR